MKGTRLGLDYLGQEHVADLQKIDWKFYDRIFQDWLREQPPPVNPRPRHPPSPKSDYPVVGTESGFWRHRDTGDSCCYPTADELEDEIVLVDLEDVDAQLIVAVDCERLTLPLESVV